MTRFFASLWTYRVLRLTLAGLFLIAGILKLSDLRAFSLVIKAFGHVPTDLVDSVALALPIVEIAAALALAWGSMLGLHTITALLMLFIGVVGHGISIGLDIDCGCYGSGDPEGEVYHGLRTTLYRDLAMLAVAVYLYLWQWLTRRIVALRADTTTKNPLNTEDPQCVG